MCSPVTLGVPPACQTSTWASYAAFQVGFNGYCYGVGQFKEGVTQMSLLDSEDPVKGVKLTYYGDVCQSTQKNRVFNIELICSDRLNPHPVSALEYEKCVYTVEMPSVYGCPLECPVAERKLCGGNGHCHYDTDSNTAHCYCNKGYTGRNCMTKATGESLNYSPTLLGLIITLFVIIGLLGAGLALMIRQVSAYREDVANYQALKGEDDGETRGV